MNGSHSRSVGVVERIEDEADAHGGAALADTLLLHEVAHVHEADEDGRKGDFHFQIFAAHDSGELSRVDHDGLEKWRTLRLFRMLPQCEGWHGGQPDTCSRTDSPIPVRARRPAGCSALGAEPFTGGLYGFLSFIMGWEREIPRTEWG